MKHINTYILSKIKNKVNITEKLKITKPTKVTIKHTLFPSDKQELKNMIKNIKCQIGMKLAIGFVALATATGLTACSGGNTDSENKTTTYEQSSEVESSKEEETNKQEVVPYTYEDGVLTVYYTKDVIDKQAAVIILQSWLDRQAYIKRQEAEAAAAPGWILPVPHPLFPSQILLMIPESDLPLVKQPSL